MEFYREGESWKHPQDIIDMLQVSGDEIDRTYIADWAGRLGLTDIWEGILRRLG